MVVLFLSILIDSQKCLFKSSFQSFSWFNRFASKSIILKIFIIYGGEIISKSHRTPKMGVGNESFRFYCKYFCFYCVFIVSVLIYYYYCCYSFKSSFFPVVNFYPIKKVLKYWAPHFFFFAYLSCINIVDKVEQTI